MDTVGQNISNVNTPGYTRQRVATSANAALGGVSTNTPVGAGVNVDTISRLGDALLDSRVQSTASAMSAIEASTFEPGETGLSATMQSFWMSWQNVANNPGNASATNVMLQAASTLTSRIAQGYTESASQWSAVHDQAASAVSQINTLATQVAAFNDQIRQTTAAGGSPNEFIDQRNLVIAKIATLAGSTTVSHLDGTIDVMVGGNPLVSGTQTRSLILTGATQLADANAAPVTVEWANHPGGSADVLGGKLAAAVAVLAPGTATTGGSIVSASETYNALATQLAAVVNAIHATGATPTGVTGLAFFAIDPLKPAALGLSVIPTNASQVAAGIPGSGAANGGIADAIAALGTSTTGPDAAWSAFVVRTGIQTGRATNQAAVATQAAQSATAQQLSQSGVDMDQESTDLLTYQRAYQGAARMMTAIDQMLDTLINRTGLAGR
jgi:flagellar hook-associated protein 1 FlgK